MKLRPLCLGGSWSDIGECRGVGGRSSDPWVEVGGRYPLREGDRDESGCGCLRLSVGGTGRRVCLVVWVE